MTNWRIRSSEKLEKSNLQSRESIIYSLIVPATILLMLVLWHAAARYTSIPEFILPSPGRVWDSFLRSLEDGSLARHTLATLVEVLGGLSIGIIAAAMLGYLLARSKIAEKILTPYIVASQSIPVVAIAPLLIIWFGSGQLSKILIAAVIVFFPVLINTIVAVRSVPQDLQDLMRSLKASRWQILIKLEAPSAMPVLLGGLKIGATLSVIGALVGEFVAADKGLGFLINVSRNSYDTAMVFVTVITLIAMTLALYSIVVFFERRLLAWREEG